MRHEEIVNAMRASSTAGHLTKNKLEKRRRLVMRMKVGDFVALGACSGFETIEDARRVRSPSFASYSPDSGPRTLSVQESFGIFMGAAEFTLEQRWGSWNGASEKMLATYACVLVCAPSPFIAWVQAKFVAMRFL